MYFQDDTIVALATPPGRGGLAVVRLSGTLALGVTLRLTDGSVSVEPRRATLARLSLPEPGVAASADLANRARVGDDFGGTSSTVLDEVVITFFKAPASYTGEDVVEISLHGSPLLATRLVSAAMAEGARMARAGEFTLRAFLNGKLDLAQAEAVQDLVSATTAAQARMAFDQLQGTLSGRIGAIDRTLFELAAKLEASVDFPAEGYHFIGTGEVIETLRSVEGRIGELIAESGRGRLLRDGATVAIVGRTNVGKSTLFNRLAGCDRAIVTEFPGTTRDLLTETVSVGGVPITLVDTAGARATEDPAEREGVNRAGRVRAAADLVLLVLDGSMPLTGEDRALLGETASQSRLVILNKADLAPNGKREMAGGQAGVGFASAIWLSALHGTAMDELTGGIQQALGVAPSFESPALSNVRHINLLRRAWGSLRCAIDSIEASEGQMPEELILSELAETRVALEEVTGCRTSEDLLNEIFSRFCVGK
jgi:tRNA modification GTPase